MCRAFYFDLTKINSIFREEMFMENRLESCSEDNETSDENSTELSSSKLGTHEYWDEVFATELKNYEEMKDVGEVWFGIASVKRVVKWLTDCDFVSKQSSILDIGCGNGMMLIYLAQDGYTDLTGVDYSLSAVLLAESVARDYQLNITYQVGDVLNSCGDDCLQVALQRSYDVVLDKGTYDAISLNPEDPQTQRLKYLHSLCHVVRHHGGLFIITSCNWTRDELLQHFSNEFELVDEIMTAKLVFGGATGSKETVLILRRL